MNALLCRRGVRFLSVIGVGDVSWLRSLPVIVTIECRLADGGVLRVFLVSCSTPPAVGAYKVMASSAL